MNDGAWRSCAAFRNSSSSSLKRRRQPLGHVLSGAGRCVYRCDRVARETKPEKGRSGHQDSDLLLINKICLATHVGADLGVMDRDVKMMRGNKPVLFADLKSGQGREDLLGWLRREYLFVWLPVGLGMEARI